MTCDVFISYAHQGDNTSREVVASLVTRLHTEIEAEFRRYFNRELEIFYDREDIKDFDHWQVRCHRALRESRFFIACLSRTYLRSDACRWEWEEWCRHELEHGLVGRGAASLWFAKLEDLDAPEDAALLRRWQGDLLQRFHIQCHEWRHDDHGDFLDAAARSELQQLTEHVAQRLRLLTLDRARRGNLPWPNANFVGRESELAELHAALLDTPEQSPMGIHGVGGMGKTALAQAFAYKEADAFPGGCWLLRCEGRDRLLTVFRSLVTELEIELTDEEKLDDVRAVRRVFDVLRARGPTLFLLDNVDHPALLTHEQMKLLADQPWARVLYTTRLAPDDFNKAGAGIRSLVLDRLPEDQAVVLIRSYQPGQAFASPEHEAAALEIVRELSGLTLAVETAGVYLGQCDPRAVESQYAVDVRTYLNKLREDLKTGGGAGVMSQLREVTATLRPTLARLDAPARTVLQIASLLAPDGAALPWVRAIAGQSHPELAADAATGESDPWTQLVRSLIGMRLFQPTAEPRVVGIHRILQRVLLAEMPEASEHEPTIASFTKIRTDFLWEKWHDSKNQWELEPFFAFVWNWLHRENADALFYANAAAWLLHELGRFREAEELFQHIFRAIEGGARVPRLHFATFCNNFSAHLAKTNRMSDAEALARKAYSIYSEFGRKTVESARCMTTLAQIFRATNRTREAERLIRDAIDIVEETNDRRTYCAYLGELGTLLQQINRIDEAIDVKREALDIAEQLYGANDLSVAIRLNNLAMSLQYAGQELEAEPLVRRALPIFKKCLGAKHPSVASCLSILGNLLKEKGELAEAETDLREALAIDEDYLGADHPDVARDLGNLALLLWESERVDEAEPLMRRHVGIFLKFNQTTDHEHPYTQAALVGYEMLLKKMGLSQKKVMEKLSDLAEEYGLSIGH